MTDVRVLADIVWATFNAINNVTTYRGEIGRPVGKPATPPLDDDGRVHAYAVVYFNPGTRISTSLGALHDHLSWGFQVTCVAGDDERLLWCIGKVRAALTGLRPAPSDPAMGALFEVGDPGPLRRDDDVTPPRAYVPLLYGLQNAG